MCEIEEREVLAAITFHEDDKAAFVAMAVEDKKRYEKEKKAYTPPAAVLD